jgi:hypothetical protein
VRCCVRINSKAQPSYEQAKPPSGTRRNQRAGEKKNASNANCAASSVKPD